MAFSFFFSSLFFSFLIFDAYPTIMLIIDHSIHIQANYGLILARQWLGYRSF
jgi:hypothetical protein